MKATNPGLGRLSCTAPLGRVLMGARDGELREARIAGRIRAVEVLAVGPGVTSAEDRLEVPVASQGDVCAAG